MKCTGRLVPGAVRFTSTGSRDHATLSREDVVYATGASIPVGEGRLVLLLSDLRALQPGRYTLTVRSRHGQRSSTRRTAITVH
jgi:hypothetical protein